MITLAIPGRLPGLNEYTGACRTHPQAGAKMKKDGEKKVGACILQQLAGVRIGHPVIIDFTWTEKDRRRDPDNIAGFGTKVILDALVEAGVLPDDSQRYVRKLTNFYDVDKNNPNIRVEIEEVFEDE